MRSVNEINPPEGAREIHRYGDFFNRLGVTRKSVLESVDLTYRRSNVYFSDLYAWMAETGTFTVACAKGCAYCCHTQVSVLPPEAFYLADHIESLPSDEARALKDRIINHDRQHRGKTGAERHEGHIACPMLDPETWLCSMHGVRPLTCRSMHSSDVSACKKGYDERDAYVPTPSHDLFFQNAKAYYQAFGAALGERGLKMYSLELNAALATIWSGRTVFADWLKGEDVFAEARAEGLSL